MLQVRARGGLACDGLVNGGLSGSKEADFLADAVGLAWPFRTGDRRARRRALFDLEILVLRIRTDRNFRRPA